MTPSNAPLISDSLDSLGQPTGTPLPVTLSHELIGLLSEQMYGSPLKAIEEIVVNSYDADATECRIFVPTSDNPLPLVAVYDNGAGMDRDGLGDLWHIGRSNKRDEQIQQMRQRKQIGKFGIGKLATYAVATRITHLSKSANSILAVTLDFTKFESSSTGQSSQVDLPVYEISEPVHAFSDERLRTVLGALGLTLDVINSEASWTLVLLENIKNSVHIHMGRLRWVLQTAMPLKIDFEVQLNGSVIESSKETLVKVVEFKVIDLPVNRLVTLQKTTKQDWRIKDDKLVSQDFPSGIGGTVIVTRDVLRTGKSDDIMRSHGFFVKIRGRLVNERDARFGLHELSHETFNRFRADIEVDDLDDSITAPREGVGDSPLKAAGQKLLNELFNEARARYTSVTGDSRPKRKEHETEYVPHTLLEYPLADVLSMSDISDGSEADDTWFYLGGLLKQDLNQTIQDLYSGVRKAKYSYDYSAEGPNERLVKFFPDSSKFILNEDHDIVRAYASEGAAQFLLEDIATAEAILEIYLRETDLPPNTVGEILEKRDGLLRSLARDHMTSAVSISQELLDASNQGIDLEIALVAAARAVGFVAKHLGGANEPDGIARLADHPDGKKTITLEAKSSNNAPTLASLDIATLAKHVNQFHADGCLLVAPSFPGSTRGNDASVAELAKSHRISCWTVKQLSDVVHAAQSRHISARSILTIVLSNFSPSDVSTEVDRLLGSPVWTNQGLYRGILKALETLSGSVIDARPSVDMVLGHLVNDPDYTGITHGAVQEGLNALASSSQGAMTVRDGSAILHASVSELRRRTSGITGDPGAPRRKGRFRVPEAQ